MLRVGIRLQLKENKLPYYKISLIIDHNPETEDHPDTWNWSEALDSSIHPMGEAEPLTDIEIVELELDNDPTCQNCEMEPSTCRRYIDDGIEADLCDTCSKIKSGETYDD
jgi:hypothetical protein